jgi:hypothetical protein
MGGVDGHSDYGLVEGNLIYNVGHTASIGHNHTVEIDRSSHTTVRYNVIHDVFKGGISLGGSISVPDSNEDVYGNIIYNVNTSNLTHFGQAPGIYCNDCDTTNIYNNVVWNVGSYVNGDSVIYVGSSDAATIDSVAVFNNIIGPSTGTQRSNLTFGNVTMTNITENNNLFYDSAGLVIKHGASTYTSLASYQAAVTPQESASLNADPLFTNVGAADFTLQAGSPAIDAGANLGSPYNFDLVPGSVWPSSVFTADQGGYGAGWEIGAYVFGAHLGAVLGGSLKVGGSVTIQ